ncbi:MAG TPA: hypothetical protein VGI66_03435 [Streptosporangiaceae bacterium]|jgi:hypothetical protein
MPQVTIEDRDTIHKISGTVIGQAGTNTTTLRWMSITLYRLDEGGLLLHRVGYSRIYHDNSGRCKTVAGRVSGSPAVVSNLPDYAEPCERCQPAQPDYLGPTETIKFEYPRHSFDICATPEEVEDKLRQRKAGKEMSEPSRSVLDQARENDPEFAERLKRVVQY